MVNEEVSDLFDIGKERYEKFLTSDDGGTTSAEKPQPEEVAYCLKEIFEHIIKKAKVRDDWSFSWVEIGNGISVSATSAKQNHEYSLGFYKEEFYLESYILEPQNIKCVSKEFWATLANLDLMKAFKFRENAGLTKSIHVDFKTGTASTYQIIRNFILLEEHQPESTPDLGSFEACWYLSEPSIETLNTAIGIFKGVHKLNYLLYRREYQKRKEK